ncbi:MAG: ABC transporter ATP-binding protein [Gammaproteobacteria bacterium]|nr:MAG: ABC transporter ATP-binding protein [Gammaproteobacteria bacterium]
MTESVLEFSGVRKVFRAGKARVVALEEVSFRLRPGVVTGVLGPDGAGKTTLMRLAAALLVPDAGRVRVLGHDVAAEPQAIQSVIGYMPQRFGLYEDLSVQENLDLYADLQGIPARARRARYDTLLHMTGLGPFTRRLAGRLSGGMKQKLGLACALLREPPLLVLDEPTVGVDPVSRRELWAIVDAQVREQGMSVLLSTAYLDEAERCAEILLLEGGRLVAQGSPRAFADEVAGRVYVLAGVDLPPRRLQRRLQAVPGIVDALLVGDHVRIVTAAPRPPALQAHFPDQPGLRLVPVSPRFEDAFIARLATRGAEGAGAPPPAPPAPTRAAPPPAGTAEDVVIEVRDLERRFGAFRAVRGVSFTVRRGEIFGLLGANGAGKTTTFRMLCGLLPPSGGTARVAGVDLRHAAARARARIGYMAQRFSLYGNLTVAQNLRFFAAAYGLAGARRRARIDWAYAEFELGRYRDFVAAQLPLGFRQRLAFAAALMHEPEILFLDEPTSGVDPLARREFWQRVNALVEAGVTVLVTTHFMEEANYCDRLVIMAEGRILAEGTPAALRARFRTPQNPEPTMEDAFIGLIEEAA